MKELKLTQNKVALVDDEDYEELCKYKWVAHRKANSWYAIRTKGNKRIPLHRHLLNPPSDRVVDHIDHDGLNNQRSNLRICTQSENMQNSTATGSGLSNYKGVSYYIYKHRIRYTAQIHTPDKLKIHLGTFDTEIEAAFVYNIAATELFGEFACLNKIPGYDNFSLEYLREKYCD